MPGSQHGKNFLTAAVPTLVAVGSAVDGVVETDQAWTLSLLRAHVVPLPDDDADAAGRGAGQEGASGHPGHAVRA